MVFNLKKVTEYCCYCGRLLDYPFRTTEHLVPKSKDGSNLYYNKKPCCSLCNNWRSNADLGLFKIDVQKHLDNKIKKNGYSISEYEIMLENIEYWQYYIETSNGKLLRKSKT